MNKNQNSGRPKTVSVYVLCGGYGTRLRKATKDRVPKPLFPINSKPIIDYNIEPLVKAKVNEVNFIVGHLGEQIVEHFQDSDIQKYTNISFTSQLEPNGVILGLKQAFQEHVDDNDFFIISDGDTIRDGLELDPFLESHIHSGANCTILVNSTENTEKHYGVVKYDNGFVKEFIAYPKPGTIPENIIFTGLVICNKNLMRLISENDHEDLSWFGLLTFLKSHGGMTTYKGKFNYFNINNPETISEVEKALSKNE